MRRFKSLVCNERAWVLTLLACNVFSLALGIIIIGLSLGTITRDIFVFQVQETLAPVYRVSCGNIASGAFLCVTAFVGFAYLNFRKNRLGKYYSILLVLMFTYQLSIGIATLLISNQKTKLLQAVTVVLCVDPSLKHWEELVSTPTPAPDAAVNITSVDELYESHRTGRSGYLDSLYAQHEPPRKNLQDCQGFADLLTPSGSLLILGTALYILMLFCTVRIRDYHKRHGNGPSNVLKNAFQDGKLGMAFKPKDNLPGVVPAQRILV